MPSQKKPQQRHGVTDLSVASGDLLSSQREKVEACSRRALESVGLIVHMGFDVIDFSVLTSRQAVEIATEIESCLGHYGFALPPLAGPLAMLQENHRIIAFSDFVDAILKLLHLK